MKWGEKSSIEKIRRLLEISERERHCQVLLTRENISAVRNNPAPYGKGPLPSAVAFECRGRGTLRACGCTASCFW